VNHAMGSIMMTVGIVLSVSAELPRVIAHRGGSFEQEENTLAGFKASYEKGARGFETDIRLTADRRAVVLHDDTLDRTTDGKGRVDQLTAAEIASVRTKKTGQPLSFLEELLDFIQSKPDAFIHVELKSGRSDAEVAALCETAMKAVADRNLTARTVFISFDVRALKKIKALDPKQQTCLILGEVNANAIRIAREIRAEYLSAHLGNLYRNFVHEAHKAGLKVTTWTISSSADAQLAILMGTDYVTTDLPAQQLERKTARP